eukprot:scaffold184919_cov31-Tisochrysis_lutea.AAC.1
MSRAWTVECPQVGLSLGAGGHGEVEVEGHAHDAGTRHEAPASTPSLLSPPHPSEAIGAVAAVADQRTSGRLRLDGRKGRQGATRRPCDGWCAAAGAVAVRSVGGTFRRRGLVVGSETRAAGRFVALPSALWFATAAGCGE